MWHFADHLQKKRLWRQKWPFCSTKIVLKTWKSKSYLLVHFIPAFFAGRPHAHAQNEKVENDNGENAQIIDFHLVLSETNKINHESSGEKKRFISREALMKKHANISFIFVLCFVVLNRVFCALLYSTFLQYHKTLSRSLDKDCDILQFFPKVIQTLWIVYGQINRSFDHIAKYI